MAREPTILGIVLDDAFAPNRPVAALRSSVAIDPTRKIDLTRSGAGTGHLPTPYSMISSARASSDGGIVKPSAAAVLRLTTSSVLIGGSTGRSPGLAPL